MLHDNAVLRRELLTMLRGHRAFLMQALFILILAGLVLVAWPIDTEFLQQRAERGRSLFRLFAIGELILVSILAPVFAAGSITMEKELHMTDLLFTTQMHPFSIFMGKFLSSVLYIGHLVVTTLPLLVVCLILGGLSTDDILSVYGGLLCVAALFGLVGLLCSAYFSRTSASLAITYLVVLPLTLVLAMVAGASTSFVPFFFIIVCATALGALVMVPLTVHRLSQPFTDVERSAEEEKIEEQAGLVLMRDRFPDNLLAPARRDDLIADRTNPVLDKEMRFEVFGRGTLLVRLIIQISIGVSIFFIPLVFTDYAPIYTCFLLTFVVFITPAFACPSFTQERERGTFDLLLTTLVTPEQVIMGKLLAAVRCTGVLTLFLSFPLLLGLKSITLAGLGQHLAVVGVTIFSTAVMSLFFSLFFRTTLVALVVTYLSVLFLYITPALTVKMLETFGGPAYQSVNWPVVTSPFFAAFAIGDWEYTKAIFPTGGVDPSFVWSGFLGIYVLLSFVLLMVMRMGYERFTTGNRAVRMGM